MNKDLSILSHIITNFRQEIFTILLLKALSSVTPKKENEILMRESHCYYRIFLVVWKHVRELSFRNQKNFYVKNIRKP